MNALLRFRPPRIALSLMAFFGLAAHWSPLGTTLHPPTPLLGLALGATGFVVMVAGWWSFRKAGTAISPKAESTVLVTAGVYRFTRNPMYLGLLGMLLGVASLQGTVLSYATPLTFFLIIDRVFIPFEEEKMARTFGVAFNRFAQETRRWV